MSLFLACLLAQPGYSAPSKDVNRPIKDKWALIVGISEFSAPDINLRYAAKDAKDFRNFLVNEGRFEADHVKLLTNSQATRENIMEELGDRWLPHEVGPDDLVVLYVSSHGSASDADVVGVNYIITYDTKPGSLYGTAIPTQDLIRMIRSRLQSDRIVLILDTCFSGAAADPDPSGAFKQRSLDVEEFAHGTGQLVICSSKPDETSQESSQLRNGVFTHFLIDGLRQHGTNTRLTDAFKYCRDKVQEYGQRSGNRQTPVMESRWEGGGLVLAALPNQPVIAMASTPTTPPPPPPPPAQSSSYTSSYSSTSSAAAATASSIAATGQPTKPPVKPPVLAYSTPSAASASLASSESSALAANVSWGKNQIAGQKAEKSGELKEAEEYYRRAVSDAEKFGPMDIRLAGSLNSLALLLNQTLRIKDAELLERRALEIYKQALGPEHRFVASALTNLGAILENKGEFKAVEDLYNQALAIMQKKLGPDDPHQANALRLLGELAMKEGRYGEAERSLKRALEINEKFYGHDSKEVAIQLNSLALFNATRHHDAEAETQYEQALNIMKRVMPSNSKDLAVTMANLGALYVARGEYGKAEPLIARAVEILRDRQTSDYPVALYHLADVYTAQGRFEQATRMYQDALRVTQATYGLQNPVQAVILHSMGIMYYKEKRYADSEDCFERALTLKQKLYPAQHQEIAATCVELANAYRDDKKYDKADPLYQRALAIYKKVLGPNSWDVYYTAKKYWRCLEYCNRTSEASQMKAVWSALEPQFAK